MEQLTLKDALNIQLDLRKQIISQIARVKGAWINVLSALALLGFNAATDTLRSDIQGSCQTDNACVDLLLNNYFQWRNASVVMFLKALRSPDVNMQVLADAIEERVDPTNRQNKPVWKRPSTEQGTRNAADLHVEFFEIGNAAFWIDLLKKASDVGKEKTKQSRFAAKWYGPRTLLFGMDAKEEEKSWKSIQSFWERFLPERAMDLSKRVTLHECWTLTPFILDEPRVRAIFSCPLSDAARLRLPLSDRLKGALASEELRKQVLMSLLNYDGDIFFPKAVLDEACATLPTAIEGMCERCLFFNAQLQCLDFTEGVKASKLLDTTFLKECIMTRPPPPDASKSRIANSWRHPLKRTLCSQSLQTYCAVIKQVRENAFDAGINIVEISLPVEDLFLPWVYAQLVGGPSVATYPDMAKVCFLAEIARENTLIPVPSKGVIHVADRIDALKLMLESPYLVMQHAQHPDIFVRYDGLAAYVQQCFKDAALDNSDRSVKYTVVGLDLIGDELPYPYIPFTCTRLIALCRDNRLGCRLRCGMVLEVESDVRLLRHDPTTFPLGDAIAVHVHILCAAVRYLRDAGIPVRIGAGMSYFDYFWNFASLRYSDDPPLVLSSMPYQAVLRDTFFELRLDSTTSVEGLSRLQRFTDKWALVSDGSGLWMGKCDCNNPNPSAVLGSSTPLPHSYPPEYCRLTSIVQRSLAINPDSRGELAYDASFVRLRTSDPIPESTLPVSAFHLPVYATPREGMVIALALCDVKELTSANCNDDVMTRYYLIPLLLHSIGIYLRPTYDLDQMRRYLDGLSLERLCESIAPPTRSEPYLHYIFYQITRDPEANATESFASLARSVFMALDILMHIMWTSQLKSYLKKQRAIFASDATLRDALFGKSNSLHSSDFQLGGAAGGLPSPKDAPSSPLESGSSSEATTLAAAINASTATMPTSLYGSGYVIPTPKLRPSLPLADSSDEKEKKEFAQFKMSWMRLVKHMLNCLGVLSKHSSVGARAVSVGLRRFEEYTRFSFEYTPPAQPLLGKLADASRGNNYVDAVWSKLKSFCSNGREEQAETSAWKLLNPIELITHSGMLVWQYASACVLYSPDDKDARAVPATATSYEWANENTESGDWPRMSVSDNVPLQLYREALAIASFVTEKRKKHDNNEPQTSNRIIGIGHTGSAVAVLAGLLLSERARKAASSRSACVWTYGAASFGSESFWRKVQARTLINLEIVCWRSKADRAFPDPESLFSPDHCSIRYIDVCPQGPPYISPWILSPSKHYFCLACHHVPVILAKRPKRRGFDLDVIVPDDEEHLLRSAVSLYAPMHTEITVRTPLSADTLEILRNYPDLFPSPDYPLAASNASISASAAAVTPLNQSAAAPTASLSGSTTTVVQPVSAVPTPAPTTPPTPAAVTPTTAAPSTTPVQPASLSPVPTLTAATAPLASVPPLPIANLPPPPHCPTPEHPSPALRVVPLSNLPYVAWRWSPTSRVSWEQLFEGAPPQQTLRYFLDLWLAVCALSRHNILIDWHPKVVAVLRWDEAAPDFPVTYEDWLERCLKLLPVANNAAMDELRDLMRSARRVGCDVYVALVLRFSASAFRSDDERKISAVMKEKLRNFDALMKTHCAAQNWRAPPPLEDTMHDKTTFAMNLDMLREILACRPLMAFSNPFLSQILEWLQSIPLQTSFATHCETFVPMLLNLLNCLNRKLAPLATFELSCGCESRALYLVRYKQSLRTMALADGGYRLATDFAWAVCCLDGFSAESKSWVVWYSLTLAWYLLVQHIALDAACECPGDITRQEKDEFVRQNTEITNELTQIFSDVDDYCADGKAANIDELRYMRLCLSQLCADKQHGEPSSEERIKALERWQASCVTGGSTMALASRGFWAYTCMRCILPLSGNTAGLSPQRIESLAYLEMDLISLLSRSSGEIAQMPRLPDLVAWCKGSIFLMRARQQDAYSNLDLALREFNSIRQPPESWARLHFLLTCCFSRMLTKDYAAHRPAKALEALTYCVKHLHAAKALASRVQWLALSAHVLQQDDTDVRFLYERLALSRTDFWALWKGLDL